MFRQLATSKDDFRTGCDAEYGREQDPASWNFRELVASKRSVPVYTQRQSTNLRFPVFLMSGKLCPGVCLRLGYVGPLLMLHSHCLADVH